MILMLVKSKGKSKKAKRKGLHPPQCQVKAILIYPVGQELQLLPNSQSRRERSGYAKKVLLCACGAQNRVPLRPLLALSLPNGRLCGEVVSCFTEH
jgi:hypothetical protein